MVVIFYNNQVINIDIGCPSLDSAVTDGAELLPDIFMGFEQFADSSNTYKVDGQWVFDFDFDAFLNDEKISACEQVQAEKSRIKNGGFEVDDILFDSDDSAQIALTQFMMKISVDATYTVPKWKASAGQWVVMDALLFSQVSAAWETHCTNCFDWQEAKEEEISACATVEELEAVSLVYGE